MKQYCIIGTGRSGSSFLASVMAGSGAHFELNALKEWDAVKGSMEHPLASKAFSYIHKINTIEKTLLPSFFFKNFFNTKLHEVLNTLKNIEYIKSSKLVYVVSYLAKLNPDVKVIVIYRDFDSYARSRHKKYGWDIEKIQAEYCNAYGTALLQLSIWGGTTIDYDELRDTSKTEWSNAIASLTGLSVEELLKNRDEVIKDSFESELYSVTLASSAVLAVEEKLRNLTNQVF